MGSKEKLLVVVVVAAVAAALPCTIIAAPTNASLAECENHCGKVSIPYPFGMGKKECYLNEEFIIDCKNSKPYFGERNIWEIMLSEGQMRLSMPVARDCYDQSGNRLTNRNKTPSLNLGNRVRFSISNKKNKFIALGCDTIAWLDVLVPGSNDIMLSTGCVGWCTEMKYVPDGTCFGIGCCETHIPGQAGNYIIEIGSYNSHLNVSSFNNCSYAFVGEAGSFTFSTSYLRNFKNKEMPLVVEWTVDNKTCKEAQSDNASYACGNHTYCQDHYDAKNMSKGYICKCEVGYKGNPYLSDGCQDINECEDQSLNTCKDNSECRNTPGNFSCDCRKGYQGDGKTACCTASISGHRDCHCYSDRG